MKDDDNHNDIKKKSTKMKPVWSANGSIEGNFNALRT
jgi:hypothetical protein